MYEYNNNMFLRLIDRKSVPDFIANALSSRFFEEMVFCYQNCDQKGSRIFLRSLEQFILTVEGQNNGNRMLLTCSWRFFMSNKLEQLEFKLEKIAGKVRKAFCFKNCSDLSLFK